MDDKRAGKRIHRSVIPVATLLLVTGWSGAAIATPPPEPEDLVADVDAAREASSSDSSEEEFLGGSESLAVRASTQLDISPATVNAASEAALPSISIDGYGVEDLQVADSGAHVASDPDQDVEIAIQSNFEGDAALTYVADNEAATSDLTFSVNDSTSIAELPDGSLLLTTTSRTAEGLTLTVETTVDAPWAVDGSGEVLDTHYVVEGRTVRQVVETDEETTYPVIADPTVRYGSLSAIIRFSKSEVKRLNPTVQKSVAVSAFCGVLPKRFAIACTAISAVKWHDLRTSFGSATRTGHCVDAQFRPLVPPAQWYFVKSWTVKC